MGKITTNRSIRSWITVLKTVGMIGLLPLALQCKDPFDWQEGDPRIPPPDPPALYKPVEDTIFFGFDGCGVSFYCEPIDGYDVMYDVQTDTTLDFSTATINSSSSSIIGAYLKRNRLKWKTDYYARVRAGSPAWTWYTAWSPSRHFYLMTDGY